MSIFQYHSAWAQESLWDLIVGKIIAFGLEKGLLLGCFQNYTNSTTEVM